MTFTFFYSSKQDLAVLIILCPVTSFPSECFAGKYLYSTMSYLLI